MFNLVADAYPARISDRWVAPDENCSALSRSVGAGVHWARCLQGKKEIPDNDYMKLPEIYAALAGQRTKLISKYGEAGRVIRVDANMQGTFVHVQLDSGPIVQLNVHDFSLEQNDLDLLRHSLEVFSKGV
ncbi:MAG: hypothetical protein ABSF85_04960 [Terriglobales bacterium]